MLPICIKTFPVLRRFKRWNKIAGIRRYAVPVSCYRIPVKKYPGCLYNAMVATHVINPDQGHAICVDFRTMVEIKVPLHCEKRSPFGYFDYIDMVTDETTVLMNKKCSQRVNR